MGKIALDEHVVLNRVLGMSASDQEIISRFPVGYYPFHPNPVLNFQMNRFWGWVGEQQMLEELRAAAPRIASFADWIKVMLELSDKALASGRLLPAAYYARMAHFFLTPDDPRQKPARCSRASGPMPAGFWEGPGSRSPDLASFAVARSQVNHDDCGPVRVPEASSRARDALGKAFASAPYVPPMCPERS